MKVTENEQLRRELLDEMLEELDKGREHFHPSVTDLVYCLTKSFYDLKNPERNRLSDQTKTYFFIGLGLENALLLDRKKKYSNHGVFEGIGWHTDSLDKGLAELKSTRSNPKKEWPDTWMRQTKSYCKANGLVECDLAVIFLIPAEFKVWHIVFGQEEVDSNWQWMMDRKAVWDEAIETGNAPEEFKWNEDWECRNCSYNIVCTARKASRSYG